MYNQRTRRIIKFIEDFGCATTSQLKTLFFPEVTVRRCRQRLVRIVQLRELKRDRVGVTNEYIYYIQKPKQVEHMLMRVDSYIKLIKDNKLSEFIPEYCFNGLEADAYIEVWRNGYTYPYFLEVQRSASFRQDKYEKLYNSGTWINKWPEFPKVIVVSDCKIHYKQSAVKYIQIKTDSPIRL